MSQPGLAEVLPESSPWIRPEARPPRRLPVLLVVAQVVAIVAAAMGLMAMAGDRPLFHTAPSGPPAAFDPANPGGGFATIEPFGEPWLVFTIAVLAVLVVGLVRTRYALHSTIWAAVRGFADVSEAVARSSGQGCAIGLAALILFILAPFMLGTALSLIPWLHSVPPGDVHGPGLNIGEITTGTVAGRESDDGWPHPRQAPGPWYVYPVEPGEAFTHVFSLRNPSPVSIRLLGYPALNPRPGESLGEGSRWVPTGLGLLRDPNVVSGAPADLVPFAPLDLAPGGEVILVLTGIGGSCALGEIDDGLAERARTSGFRGWPFIYEILGWRREAVLWLPVGIDVPADEACLSD